MTCKEYLLCPHIRQIEMCLSNTAVSYVYLTAYRPCRKKLTQKKQPIEIIMLVTCTITAAYEVQRKMSYLVHRLKRKKIKQWPTEEVNVFFNSTEKLSDLDLEFLNQHPFDSVVV